MIAIEPIKIFYCYVSQDRKLRDQLEKHLIMLKRLGQITFRLNREIEAGTNWSHVEDGRFQRADLILLLISPDFLYSDYHYGIEMRHALEKHEAGNVWVIPILLRPTPLWEQSPLGKLRALPKDGKALTEHRNRDIAFTDLVKGLSEVVALLFARKLELASTTKADEEKVPKFTQVIGPLCATCGARNPLGVITCENCGDLLLTITPTSAQEAAAPHSGSSDAAQMPFFSHSAPPDLTDESQTLRKASEKGLFACSNCGTNNPPDEEFCVTCGAYLVGAASAGAIMVTPGAQLDHGRYVVEQVLGQGGMGAALLAKDRRVSNKLVVIKELISDTTDPAKHQEDVRNFAREVETLAHLDHPLIPNVTASFEEESHYFMVQEYVFGENLEERIDRLKQPLSEQEVLTYASQILDVLDYLEQQRPPLVHRDIKPANIIISSRNKRAYVVDFGIARADRSIARAEKSISKQTVALGTAGYAPPEQYEGNADPRSDLYALGATMHHLLTNRDPRNYPSFAYPPARSLNPKLSPEIEPILTRALMTDIAKRYQNAAAMKHDIDEILTQRFAVTDTSIHTFAPSGPITTTATTATQTAASNSSHSPNTFPPSTPLFRNVITTLRGGISFLRNLSTPDSTDTSASPSKASEKKVLVCPNCRTSNLPDEEFCSHCGAYLDGSATVASVATHVNLAGASSAGSLTLTPGAQLENGRYVIEKVLGQGGMGAALLAKDTPVSNKLVVIKELISDNTDPEKRQEDVRNFAREVDTLSKLDHPLIPIVTDSFQQGTHYFMVQEYVPGENLEDRMDRVKQPMPEQEALTYASQILDILKYLEHFEYDNENGTHHKTPIVHRDIKPANIIISSRNKRAYLVDFGIARAIVDKSAKRKQMSALGTPGYAPPEQYQGNAEPRSDLYALAATLHHVLTNRDPRNYPPFAYPPARSLNPKLSPQIERILNRALMIDITKRYQNAAAMKHDVDEILTQRFGASNISIYTLGTSGPTSP